MAASRESLSSQCDGVSLYSPGEAAALVSRLCEALLGVSSYAHIVNPELAIPEESLPALQAAIERLAAGEPLQYVLGYSDFLGMRLRVTPAVLIPRPETEELCRRVIAGSASRSALATSDSSPAASASGSPAALSFNPVPPAWTSPAAPRAILDLCCGSGCITWAMAGAFPDALVVGVDLSADALEVARSQNGFSDASPKAAAASTGIPGAASAASPSTPSQWLRSTPEPLFLQADVLDIPGLLRTLKSVLKQNDCPGFDLLLSNPPYVREQERSEMSRNVLDFEPSMALFVPDDDALRFYRAIREVWFSPLLHARARLALEINEALGPETLALFQAAEPLPFHRLLAFSTPASHHSVASSNVFAHLEKDLNEKNRYIFAEK